MSAFTPGPWSAGIGYDGRGNTTVYADEWNTVIARVRCGKINGILCPHPNARLIAAAPDLYRELRHLVNLLQPLEADGSLNVPGAGNAERRAQSAGKGGEPR
jgi:hypothetical protein